MANTKSAKKAVRSSARKRQANLYWKQKIKKAEKSLQEAVSSKEGNVDILNKQLSILQKVLDKAAKERVVHKNKANRLKARYAKKVSVQTKSKPGSAKPKKAGSTGK